MARKTEELKRKKEIAEIGYSLLAFVFMLLIVTLYLSGKINFHMASSLIWILIIISGIMVITYIRAN